MEVSFNPELQAQLDKLASQAGRPTDELVREVMTGYVQELTQTRDMLDRRYDDIKSGRVKLIPGDAVEAELRQRIAERSSPRS